MHIVIIPSWYPSLEDEIEYGSFFREQAQSLKRFGYQVGVISPQLRSLRYLTKKVNAWKKGLHIQDDDGVMTYRYYRWSYLTPIPYFYPYLFLTTGKKLFEQYIDRYGLPDLIHVHSAMPAGTLAVYLKEKYSIPVVLTEHSSGFANNYYKRWQHDLISKSFMASDKLIAVSPNLAQLLNQKYNNINKWEWIPNLVNSTFFDTQSLEAKRSGQKFIFLNIALMNSNKKQENLIRSFAKKFKDRLDIELHIGGNGQLKSYLHSLVNEFGIEKQVRFLGALTRNQVVEHMINSSVFVLSSDYETFSVVLVEALACGKPVIATACGGPECMVNERNGLLIPPHNIEYLAIAMKQMYDNFDLYDSQKIRHDCLLNFGEESIVEKLSFVYSKVVE
jgi:glycosyltransferase involved in cell wall biosynthesis